MAAPGEHTRELSAMAARARVVAAHVARHPIVGGAMNQPDRYAEGQHAGRVCGSVAAGMAGRAAAHQLAGRAIAETLPKT
jgi:hypothetical protein